jgi:HK97 gp10 family phage protein
MAVKIVFNRLHQLRSQMLAAVSGVVRGTALDVEARAKDKAPVDTGALRASIKTETVNPLLAEVGTNIEYAAINEYGGAHHPAQPYMTPAAEEARPTFIADMKAIL